MMGDEDDRGRGVNCISQEEMVEEKEVGGQL